MPYYDWAAEGWAAIIASQTDFEAAGASVVGSIPKPEYGDNRVYGVFLLQTLVLLLALLFGVLNVRQEMKCVDDSLPTILLKTRTDPASTTYFRNHRFDERISNVFRSNGTICNVDDVDWNALVCIVLVKLLRSLQLSSSQRNISD